MKIPAAVESEIVEEKVEPKKTALTEEDLAMKEKELEAKRLEIVQARALLAKEQKLIEEKLAPKKAKTGTKSKTKELYDKLRKPKGKAVKINKSQMK